MAKLSTMAKVCCPRGYIVSTNMTTMKDAVYRTSEKEDMTSERTDEVDVWYVSGSKAGTAYTVNLNTTTCMLLQLRVSV